MATATLPKNLAPVETAYNAWTSASFVDIVTQMNDTMNTIKQQREQSLAARKTLAETTKQFKRSVKTADVAASTLMQTGTTDPNAITSCNAMDALSKECRHIVKSYQEEIDNLTRRCKSTEQYYNAVFITLSELPDPAETINVCIRELDSQNQQMQQLLKTVEKVNQELENSERQKNELKDMMNTMEKNNNNDSNNGGNGNTGGLSNDEKEELIQLRKEVAEYEVEFRSLKNQDITIRKLEDRIIELETAGAESIEKTIAQAREEIALVEGRRATEALEREATLEAKVQALQLQLKAERAGREATQNVMLEADEGLSRREAAWEAQRQILVDDNERVRESLQTIQRERDELKMKLAAIESPSTAPPSGSGARIQDLLLERNAYEAEVSELSETNSLLREEIRVKEEQLVTEKREYQARIDALEREKSTLNTTLASLESQLSSAPSQSLVDNMKRELRILKRLEYNADDVDYDRDPEIVGSGEDEKDLEAVLVAKLRKAEKELIYERNNKTELQKELESLRESLEKTEKSRLESVKLVASLEKDLERAIAAPVNDKPKRERKGTLKAKEDPATLQNILEPGAAKPAEVSSAPTTSSASATEKAQDDHSVATIVMAQRDRLRARCEALEAERDSFKRELQCQVQAAESLKSDNTKLYEKVRYLQNYSKTAGSKAYHRAASSGERDLDLEALEQRYEASVDPFKQFSKNERQRKLGEMSPMERTVFVVARTVLSTKEMRTGLFFYMLALHLLVFITTYHWSHEAGCNDYTMENEHLSNLPPDMQQHIQQQIMSKAAEQGTTSQKL